MKPNPLLKPIEGVSRETHERFLAYHELLLKWQHKINLISKNTIEHAWERHFADSAQLRLLCPQGASILVDLGSGAGFPGLVLAMMRPELDVHLIESDQKKCSFLQTISRETRTKVQIHNQRIEEVPANLKPDIITARALAPLEKLLTYSMPFIDVNPDLVLIFPKGAKAAEELDVAQKSYRFDFTAKNSKTDAGARILILKNVHKI